VSGERVDLEAKTRASEKSCERVVASEILNSSTFFIHFTIHNKT